MAGRFPFGARLRPLAGSCPCAIQTTPTRRPQPNRRLFNAFVARPDNLWDNER